MFRKPLTPGIALLAAVERIAAVQKALEVSL
jgi:hypothetical protein